MNFVIQIINFFVAVAISFSMVALYFRGKSAKSTKIFIACEGMIAAWCSSQIFIEMAPNDTALALSFTYGDLAITFIGLHWLWFALLSSNRKVNWEVIVLTSIVPMFHFISILTNPLHHKYYKYLTLEHVKHDILFKTNFISIYIYVVIGAVILFKDVSKTQSGSITRQYKARFLIVLSVLIPTVISLVNLFSLSPVPYDTNAIGFAIAVFLVYRATFKYRFLDLERQLQITNEKLLLETERNRIAQQVHDTAGHTLTMIQSYMKLAENSVENDNKGEALEYIQGARKLTTKGIRELRESINMLREESEYALITQGVMHLANQVKDINVEVTVKGEDSEKYSHLTKVVYDSVRESITNSLKYSQAQKLDIILTFKEKSIQLMIVDDGVGCAAIDENNGIQGIRERVEKANGTVRFVTAPNQGFLTRVELPI